MIHIHIYIIKHIYIYIEREIDIHTHVLYVRPVRLLRVRVSVGLKQTLQFKGWEFSCLYNSIGSLPESSTRGLLVGKLLIGGLGVYVHGGLPWMFRRRSTAVPGYSGSTSRVIFYKYCVYTYTYTYIYIYIYVCVYIYIYTYHNVYRI